MLKVYKLTAKEKSMLVAINNRKMGLAMITNSLVSTAEAIQAAESEWWITTKARLGLADGINYKADSFKGTITGEEVV